MSSSISEFGMKEYFLYLPFKSSWKLHTYFYVVVHFLTKKNDLTFSTHCIFWWILITALWDNALILEQISWLSACPEGTAVLLEPIQHFYFSFVSSHWWINTIIILFNSGRVYLRIFSDSWAGLNDINIWVNMNYFESIAAINEILSFMNMRRFT